METLSLSIINLRTNYEIAIGAKQVYINKSPDFQRTYEAWDDKLRTRFVESMLVGRATNPIWTVLNTENDSEEILDGMHRITTALSFLNNEFSISKQYLLTLDPELYHNKNFENLSSDDKSKIRNYNFIFNKLDSSYRADKNKLRDMYEILNRSSSTLNEYEFNKVILNPFYEIITKHKNKFSELHFFQKKDQRGNMDSEIIELLILTYDLPSSWSSVSKLTKDWIENNIGTDTESVIAFIEKNKENIEEKLIFLIKIIKDFTEQNLFSNDTKIFKKLYLPYKFIIARCCHIIKNYSLFNRHCGSLINKFNTHIFINDFLSGNRNAAFQKRIIEQIDNIINVEVETSTPRLFTKKQIEEQKQKQNNICPYCNKEIKISDEYHGDHIIAWSAGGETLPDNLQVLHKRCHQLKSIR
jgi:hypothetical protein